MNIVTGYTGVPHITANEAQALNQGIFGTGNYVLDLGSKFAATIVDTNTIAIQDGEGVMQGVQFRIAPGDTDTVTIANGTTGYNRIDLICARYTKDAQTGVEAVNLVVIEGTPNASTPTAPSYNTGTILDGDSPVDFPLYTVTITGLVPTLSAMFEKPMLQKLNALYELPFYSNSTYDLGTRLFVLPSVRIMIIALYAKIPANYSGDSIIPVSRIPYIRGSLGFFYENLFYPLVRIKSSDSTIVNSAYAQIYQNRDITHDLNSNVSIISTTNSAETMVYGTLVAFYSEYYPTYPLSRGTLLEDRFTD